MSLCSCQAYAPGWLYGSAPKLSAVYDFGFDLQDPMKKLSLLHRRYGHNLQLVMGGNASDTS